MIWFTSDTHFSHENIIKYCDRPFDSTDHMDEEIIRRWNEAVSPEDTVYHLGDIALGPIADSLPKIARLNGHKIAIFGNHDRPFMRMNKVDEDDWWIKYENVFEFVIDWYGTTVDLGGREFRLSHFPYIGDSHDEDRYDEFRPEDVGIPLIHGHTHSTDRLTFSKSGTPQVHVGMDAWDYRPVSENEVLELLDKHSSL